MCKTVQYREAATGITLEISIIGTIMLLGCGLTSIAAL